MPETLSALLNDPSRAWAPYEPGPDAPWDLARVAHLHRRAGFAAPWSILQRDLADGPAASVDRLLKGEPVTPDGRTPQAFEALESSMTRQLAPGAGLTRLQALWLHRMVFTPHPLRERMTLFWHDHFATSEVKVQNAGLMQRQNDLFRAHALGDFKTLLDGVGRDPAMLLWLDSTENKKASPNENYAREVMELFTLGRDQYTERDIREAARALTGGFVRRDRYVEVDAQHDDGAKTVLGKTGRFRGGDLPAILLEQPACARFLCGKLVRAFVTEVDPIGPELLERPARAFRESGYDISVPLGLILRSNLFHSGASRRRRVKSPVELAVGTLRALEVLSPTVQADALAEACASMGQSLYAPPSVAGWDGGPAWINSTAVLSRNNFVLALVGTENQAIGRRLDPAALAERHGFGETKPSARFFNDLLLQDAFGRDPLARLGRSASDPRAAATLILTSPEYQLA